ncbi:MAG TPA: transketolase C-terminal domain-containing protein [Thermoleophilaceae bacterium]
MRNAFAEAVTEQAARDERVMLLSGDIGNRLFDQFKAGFPERFINCGVAEANMTGMAAGLALSGMRPVTYTITPFVTTRCLEQIKVDICYHEAPVVIVGTGAGLSYASLGATHHSLDDIALLRVFPGMKVVCPCDTHEVRAAVRAALEQESPVYIRLGKKGEPSVHESPPEFTLGRAITLRSGTDVCILGTGNIVPTALEAADRLESEGVSTRVVSFHTVKPLDEGTLTEAFASFPLVVTVEEHGLAGGFGSAVAEWLVDRRDAGAARLLRIGAADLYLHEAGGQSHARGLYGLVGDQIAARAREAYRAAVAEPARA